MKSVDFLKAFWEAHPEDSWVFIAARRGKRWIEKPLRNDRTLSRNVRALLRQYPAKKYDLYFCPNAFGLDRRLDENALSTPYAWCDIDGADPDLFVPIPGVLVETSPGRFQGYWRFKRSISPRRAAAISRQLTYDFGGDRGGWSVTKMLRIPGTRNHKYEDQPLVALRRLDLSPVDPKPLLKAAPRVRHQSMPKIRANYDFSQNRKVLFKKYWRKIENPYARSLLLATHADIKDRSKQIYIMIRSMAEADVPESDIASLIWRNPYFQSKHGDDLDALQAEISRIMQNLKMEKKK
ncbi:MAG: DNA-primase RepB domain-containing protein [Alphaproteobacteria bacterium]